MLFSTTVGAPLRVAQIKMTFKQSYHSFNAVLDFAHRRVDRLRPRMQIAHNNNNGEIRQDLDSTNRWWWGMTLKKVSFFDEKDTWYDNAAYDYIETTRMSGRCRGIEKRQNRKMFNIFQIAPLALWPRDVTRACYRTSGLVFIAFLFFLHANIYNPLVTGVERRFSHARLRTHTHQPSVSNPLMYLPQNSCNTTP